MPFMMVLVVIHCPFHLLLFTGNESHGLVHTWEENKAPPPRGGAPKIEPFSLLLPGSEKYRTANVEPLVTR